MPSQLFIYGNGTAADDFILGIPDSDTLNGSDGDDYILGDTNFTSGGGTTNSFGSASNINGNHLWTQDENPFIASSTSIPHTSLYVLADAGQMHYSSVTVGAGQAITVDIDFGGHVIGTSTDVIVELYNSAGTLVATNDDAAATEGGAGSTSGLDSFLTGINTSGFAEVFTIRFSEFGSSDGGVFEGGETFVANISVTGHAVTTPTVMGDDTLSGGLGDDTIAGQGGNDILNGDEGNDTLFGGTGEDTLNGGTGADEMTGGLDDDTYTVDDEGDVVVEAAIFGTDHVSSSISYGLGANVENLTLTGSGTLEGSGNNAANVLTGNSAANALLGFGGNDTLVGGGGADAMYGGTGDDIYVVDNSVDQVYESSGAGIDEVRSSVSEKLSANVENLTLTGTASIHGDGNNLNNLITGNAGNNRLNGGTGADTMSGGTGNDTYVVDNIGDIVTEAAGEGTDLVKSSLSHTLGSNVEKLTLTGAGAISGTGNALANVITGNGAANTLRGEGHNDILSGGGGADDLYGGVGNDRLTGGSGTDDFFFDTALNATTNVDTIIDFSSADDTIQLDLSVFTGVGAEGMLSEAAFCLGTTAADADDRIIYDSATGKLFYDADGSDAGAAVLFAQVTAGTILSNVDFIAFG